MKRAISLILTIVLVLALPALAFTEGDFDETFSDLGTFRLDLGADEFVTDLFADPDGRLLVTGSTEEDAFVVALTADGTPDTSFTDGGSMEIEPEDVDPGIESLRGGAVARDSENRVVVAGTLAEDSMGGTNVELWVTRRLFDGLADPDFGTDGHAIFNAGTDETVNAMFLEPDGSITVVGTAGDPIDKDAAPLAYVIRITPEGDVDPDFGDDGLFRVERDGSTNIVAAARDDQGRIVLARTSGVDPDSPALKVIRLLPDGAIDPDFTETVIDQSAVDIPVSVAISPGGRIVVTGVLGVYVMEPAFVHRLGYDGGLDLSLTGTGSTQLAPDRIPIAAFVDEVGRTVLGVIDLDDDLPLVTRLRTNGLDDPSLIGSGGILGAEPIDIAPSINDTVVMAGTFNGLADRDLFVTRHQVSVPDITFGDDDGSIFEDDIEAIAAAGITLGCDADGNYCPSDLVTRGQMAAFLVRGIGYTDDGGGDLFGDDDGSIFEDDIDKLATAAVTLGCDVGRYCPNDLVTRGQMAAFLVRALGYTDGAGDDRFSDDDNTTFEADIDRLAAAGITQGCDVDRFCPNDPVTRGQMAAFLARALGLGS